MYQIYKITNLINNKCYVGMTKQSLKKRFQQHSHLNDCRCLYAAINKYGKENFKIESLMDEISTVEEACAWEVFCIEASNSLTPNGYNLLTGGRNYEDSDETKKLKSLSHKNKMPGNINAFISGGIKTRFEKQDDMFYIYKIRDDKWRVIIPSPIRKNLGYFKTSNEAKQNRDKYIKENK
jgi:group I intron endonuclease